MALCGFSHAFEFGKKTGLSDRIGSDRMARVLINRLLICGCVGGAVKVGQDFVKFESILDAWKRKKGGAQNGGERGGIARGIRMRAARNSTLRQTRGEPSSEPALVG